MGENTKIQWCDHTFNPWEGCSKVSDGCKNCYAEARAKRFGSVIWGEQGTRRRTSDANWKKPLKWNRDAQRDGVRRKVFCASLADVFEDRPELEGWRYDLWELINKTPHLDWLLLTKRPQNVIGLNRYVRLGMPSLNRPRQLVMNMMKLWNDGTPPANVWIGTSVENQEQADKRIPELLKIPAKVRFLSCEPLLAPVDLSNYLDWQWDKNMNMDADIHWVIVGGESGPNARPMHPDWARSIRDQCQSAGVPYFFKQWGEFSPIDQWPESVPEAFAHGVNIDGRNAPAWLRYCNCQPGWTPVVKVGKHAAGRLLDGREWNEMPEATS